MMYYRWITLSLIVLVPHFAMGEKKESDTTIRVPEESIETRSIPTTIINERASEMIDPLKKDLLKNQKIFDQLKGYIYKYDYYNYHLLLPTLKMFGLQDQHGNTILHMAALSNNIAIFMEALKYPFDLEMQNDRGNTPLHITAQTGNINMLNALVLKKVNINAENYQGETPALVSVYYGRQFYLRQLQAYGADMNKGNEKGLSPVHIAAYRGLDSILYELIRMGADVNKVDEDKITPLHYAAGNGHKNSVEILLKYGAKIEAKDLAKNTPLYNSVVEGQREIFKALYKKGADIGFIDSNGRDLLQAALSFKRYRMAYDLLPIFKDKLEHQDKNGNTALHLAINTGYAPIIKELQALSSVNIQNDVGKNAVLMGVQKKVSTEILYLMMDHKEFEPDQQDHNGESLLHYQVRYKNKHILDYMKSRSVEFNRFIKNEKGDTPFTLASKLGDGNTINYYLNEYQQDILGNDMVVKKTLGDLEQNKHYFLARKIKKQAWNFNKKDKSPIVVVASKNKKYKKKLQKKSYQKKKRKIVKIRY